MPLYRKQKPKIYKTESELVGNTNTPLGFKQPVPERNIGFENAKPTVSDFNQFVITALQVVQGQDTILGTNLPTINKENDVKQYIKPIFLGSPGNPTEEYLYANPNKTLDFVTDEECEKVFLFANLQAKKNSTKDENGIPRGFEKLSDKKDKNIPNAITSKLPSDTNEKYQLVFLEQTNNDSKIKINAYDLVVNNVGKGISTVISTPVQLDTWYNTTVDISGAPDGRSSRWIDYNIGDNVTVGSTNDTLTKREIGERYNWSFGSIFLTKTFGSTTRNPDETYREIKYTFTDDKIILSDWDFVFQDSPTTYSDRYTTKVKLISDEKITNEEQLNQEEIKNGVVGRKIFTYLIKAFEEGECIRIEEVYGGIRINVDFNYNGRCCEQFIPSSSSQETCYTLIPGEEAEYELDDGKVCVIFEGDNDQIAYVNICGESIPVSTKDGFLTWNYGIVGEEYLFDVFNGCQGFWTSNGCYYEVCFVGFPQIKFTLQVISKSSSSTSSVSYSSSSSSSSSTSMGNSSSSSSVAENQSESSKSSKSSKSLSSNSSSSSFSSPSRSSDSSSESTSSTSAISTSSQSISSTSSRSTSSSSSSSLGFSTSSVSETSVSDSSTSVSSISYLDVSDTSKSLSSRSSRSSTSSSDSRPSSDSESVQSSSSLSSNVPMDWDVIYPTDSYLMYALKTGYASNSQTQSYGLVAGDCYGFIDGIEFQNAFAFTEQGDIITFISTTEQNLSYALDVDTLYTSLDNQVIAVFAGYFANFTQDLSGNQILVGDCLDIFDATLQQRYTLILDNLPSPFAAVNLTPSQYATCVRFIHNYLFICGQVTNAVTGRTGFIPAEIGIINNTDLTITTQTSGAAFNYSVGITSGEIMDLVDEDDFLVNNTLWAVGDFNIGSTYTGIVKIGPSNVTFNYKLLDSGGGNPTAYSIYKFNNVDQELSSVSDESSDSQSSTSISDSTSSTSTSSKSSTSESSYSYSYSSLSDFSSKSSPSSISTSFSSDSSESLSSISLSNSSLQSFYSFEENDFIMIVGGRFTDVHLISPSTVNTRKNLAFFDSNGNLLKYQIISNMDGPIKKVLYDNLTGLLYLGGDFTSVTDIKGVTYTVSNLIAFHIDPYNDKFTYVNIDVRPNNAVNDMAILNNKIFICGAFEGINSKYRPGVGAFNRINFNVY